MELSKVKTVEQLAAMIKSHDMVTSVAWTDYTASSTITGWSSTTTEEVWYKKIGNLMFVQFHISGTTTTEEVWYKKIGNLMFVQFHISGTSDAGDASFTLPYSQQGNLQLNVVLRVRNNGTLQTGLGILPVSSTTFSCYQNLTGNAFTASGSKLVIGQFWYEVA
jgi:hypothetical protein